jgi:predicted ATPase with chaperone activity
MKEHCRIDDESSMLLENTMSQMNFSARAHDRILKSPAPSPISKGMRTSPPTAC